MDASATAPVLRLASLVTDPHKTATMAMTIIWGRGCNRLCLRGSVTRLARRRTGAVAEASMPQLLW